MKNLFTSIEIMKNQLLATLTVGLLAGSMTLSAEPIVDTGPGPNEQAGIILSQTQWLAGEFIIADEYLVSSLELWMYDYYSTFGLPNSVTYTIAIYSDGGGVPGAEIFSGDFSADNDTPEWRGLTGVAWDLLPGTYWVTFEVRNSPFGDGVVPRPSLEPLANYALLNTTSTGGEWINAQDLYLPIGIRIMGERLSPTGLYQISATGMTQETPGGGSVTTSDWTLIFDDISNDGVMQVEEIVSFSGATVTTTGTYPATYSYDNIVGSPPVSGISTQSGGFNECCWWFTGSVTAEPQQDGWYPRRWTYNKIAWFDTPEYLLGELVTSVVDLNVNAGIGNALDSKLQNVLDALKRAQSGDSPSAIGMLYAFINSVESQRDKAITSTQADELVGIAQSIITLLEE